MSCSVSERELRGRDVVSWWEGAKQLEKEEEKGGYSIFRGQKASQLHLCLKKEHKERRVKCRFDQQVEINFSLTEHDLDSPLGKVFSKYMGVFMLHDFLKKILVKPLKLHSKTAGIHREE